MNAINPIIYSVVLQKMMKSLTSTFLVFSLCLLPLCQCDDKLIQETCKRTPDYFNICVPLLKSDPRSANADVRGLAEIMILKVEARATSALNKITELLEKIPKDPALNECSGKVYGPAVRDHIPAALTAIKYISKGSAAGIAKTYMHNICNDVASCQEGFKGQSPITVLNQDVVKAATLAQAIAMQIS